MPKIIYLVGDGMGDWPLEILGGQTCLEAAQTPTLDQIAPVSRCGTCQTVPDGMAPGSDVANMSLLGYDPRMYHTGRGPIEAAAQGLSLASDDLVWRMNLVTVSEWSAQGLMQDYSSGHITTEVAAPLLESITQLAADSAFTPVQGIQYRHLLVQRGGATTEAAGLEVRPPHDILDQPIAEDIARFARIPELAAFMDAASAFLQRDTTSPANAVWPWGQGKPLALPLFAQTFGLRGAVVSAVDLVKGLGRAAGMDVLDVPGVTGLIDTNYEGKVQAALEFLATGGDFVYLHVEAPDECGHMGDARLKKQAIELFDSRIVRPIVSALAETEVFIVVTCDHFTPVSRRTHTTDPVPFLVYAPHEPRPGGPARFTEALAGQQGVFLPQGLDLFPYVTGKSHD